jgi:hypothetical protein
MAIENTIKMVSVCCILISLIGVFQYYQLLPFNVPGNVWHIPYSTMANKNLFASLLFMMLPFIIYGIIFRGLWMLVNFVALFLATVNIILSQTRAVWLAIGGSLVFLIAVVWFFYSSKLDC